MMGNSAGEPNNVVLIKWEDWNQLILGSNDGDINHAINQSVLYNEIIFR